MAQPLTHELADVVVSVVGDAAGATIDRKAGLANLAAGAASPVVLVSVALAAAGYLLGRRAHS